MNREERKKLLEEKLYRMKAFDRERCADGYAAGIDEVGRGPLAGPVVAACVVLPADFDVPGIDDSKKLSEKKREELYKVITEKALAWSIGMADNETIDRINILQATKQAMTEAAKKADDMLVTATGAHIDMLLLDAVHLEDMDIQQESIIKGDAQSLSIAAASIVAKVTRDRMMVAYNEKYPGYGFDSNKGYGTKAHYEGISKWGVTPIHRKTFLKNL